MMRFVVVLALLPLMGCVAETPPVQDCPAAELQHLVGQSATVLQTMRFGVTVRFIHPGDAVTEDFAPGRLNIHIDGNETIAAVDCG